MSVQDKISGLIDKIREGNRASESLFIRLNDALLRGGGELSGTNIIGSIVEFCASHFKNQNSAMMLSGYQSYYEHASEHFSILNSIIMTLSRCVEFGELEWAQTVREFRKMYYDHIAHFDDPLMDFLLNYKKAADTLPASTSIIDRLGYISNHHLELERLIGMLDEVVINEKPLRVRLPVLGLIVEYCSRHIREEEDVMRISGYEARQQHFEDHGRILNIVSNILERCEAQGEVSWTEFSKELRGKYFEHRQQHDLPLFEGLAKLL